MRNWIKEVFNRNSIQFGASHRAAAITRLEPLVLMSGSTIDIYASGDEGIEIMELRIDDEVVEVFENIPTGGGVFTYESEELVEANQVKIAFINDVFDPVNAIDANLNVDKIVIDGETFETESPTVLGTGVWTGSGFEPGFHEAEQLAGVGYFHFDAGEGDPDPGPGGEPVDIVIYAEGTEGGEAIRVSSNGFVLADFVVTTSPAAYSLTTPYFTPGDNLRIEFTNDLWNPEDGIDRNLIVDRIEVDGFTYETEAPGVFSTGTFRPDIGIQPGYPQAETLHADGYFEYVTQADPVPPEPNPTSVIEITAHGDEGTESFNVLSGGHVLAEFDVSTSLETFSLVTTDYVPGDDVRVEFTNDFWDPDNGVDANLIIQSVAVNGEVNDRNEILYSNGIVDYEFVGSEPDPDASFSLLSDDIVFVSESEGIVSLTAVRTGSLEQTATLEYSLNALSGADPATPGVDFVTPTFDGRENTGVVVFGVGQSQAVVEIPIVNDELSESTETFGIGIQNQSSGSLGVPRTAQIAIVDEEGPSTISLSASSLTVTESQGEGKIAVERSGNLESAASVEILVTDGTAEVGQDFTGPASSVVTFEPGEFFREIEFQLTEDDLPEGSENFSVSIDNPSGAELGSIPATDVLILDNDIELSDLSRTDYATGLISPTTLDWTPDGTYLLVAEQSGVVRVIEDGQLRGTPLIEITSQVNSQPADRGLLGMAVHPDFADTPYLYLLYTYDPPETFGQPGNAGPDRVGNRPSRLVRVTVDPETMIADPESLVVLVGKNSTWEFTSRPDVDSTGNVAIPPSGIVNGTTITAEPDQIDVGELDNAPDIPGVQNQNIRDYLATDSTTHTIGDLEFGPDGYLYLTNGDGSSPNFVDSRTVRVQDIDNLSGKMLRIDPLTGEGVETNPFYNGDGDSNRSKVFYSGLRNAFRFTFDPVSQLPVIGDVGWTTFEEINTGPAGSNFGWPFLEGPALTGGYQNLDAAIAFYENGNRNDPSDEAAVFPILPRNHGAPDNANAIVVGDFFDDDTLLFGDVINGTLYAATFDEQRAVSDIQVFDTGNQYLVDLKVGPDGMLYGVNLVSGTIHRWEAAVEPTP